MQKRFEVLDSKGSKIHIKDEVDYRATSRMGDDITLSGFVIGLLPAGLVEVQGDSGGVPILVDARDCTVTRSLIGDILSLQTHEEFQETMVAAEDKYRKEVERMKKTKTRAKASGAGKGRKKAAPKKEMEQIEITI